jgi:site-specific DNA-cytosine methylase
VSVLVACEFSGVVRDAFRDRGHEAYSCDLLPADGSQAYHIQNDAIEVMNRPWDLMIAHPPCTHLAVSGARHFKAKQIDGRQQAAIDFFMALANAPIHRIAIENPVCIMSTKWRKPDQTFHPWMFGHGEVKRTCLWLKNLPPLIPTKISDGRESRIHKMPPSKDRGQLRSITFSGVASAMADQWGRFL